MKDLILLKIGGSVCTEKSRSVFKGRASVVKRIAGEILDARKSRDFRLIVVNGAGPFGHVNVKQYDINDGLKTERDFEGYAKTICDCSYLNWKVADILRESGLHAFPYPTSSVVVQNKKRISSFNADVIRRGWGSDESLVPVMNGTMVPDLSVGGSVISGDTVLWYLTKTLRPKLLVFATDVDGIFTGDPTLDRKAKLLERITKTNFGEVKGWISGSSGVDVTGGMLGKVEKMLDLDVECVVVNGNFPGRVRKALLGEEVTRTVVTGR